MEGKILSFVVKEELEVLFDGKVYKLKFEGVNTSFNGMSLSKEELGELKKLPSNLAETLSAKFFFKGSILEVKAEKQTGFVI